MLDSSKRKSVFHGDTRDKFYEMSCEINSRFQARDVGRFHGDFNLGSLVARSISTYNLLSLRGM